MDKTFLIFVIIGVGALYFVSNSVSNIQKEDETYRNDDYNEQHRYDAYQGKDSIGRNILNLYSASSAEQIDAWNDSQLKEKYISLFPDFDEMIKFTKERVHGDYLNKKLFDQVKSIEKRFISGKITSERAMVDLKSDQF
jgi:hypothetical protein